MNCGHGRREIEKELQKLLKRKTIPKETLFKALKLFADSVKFFEHIPGCYLPGQKPPTLSAKCISENILIKEFNEGIDEELKKCLSFQKIKKVDGRTRLGKITKYRCGE